MTVLDCSVTNCFYNKEKRCSKGGIQVEGRMAEKTSETCCGSFKERGESMSNSMLSASSEIDVSCDACNCKFNRDSKCSANHIGIAGANACKCAETECSSFDCKCGCRS